MKTFRLNRLFNAKSGRCFDVAIDHGFFNERAFLSGIENLDAAVRTLVEAAPDAIQLTVGQAPLLQSLPGRFKPSLVLRTDVANVYGKELPHRLFSRMIAEPVEQALRPGRNVRRGEFIRHPRRARSRRSLHPKHPCHQTGLRPLRMPLMIEPLVFRPNSEAGGYMVNGDPEKILPLVRQAVELGADIIKADPTDDVGTYHQVIEIAGRIPVLVRGGGKAPDQEILARTETLIKQGAAGIVLRAQRHPARQPSRHDACAHEHRSRWRDRRRGRAAFAIDFL